MKMVKLVFRYLIMLLCLMGAIIGGIILPETVFRMTDSREAENTYAQQITALDLTLSQDMNLSISEKMYLASQEDNMSLITTETVSTEQQILNVVDSFFETIWEKSGEDAEAFYQSCSIGYLYAEASVVANTNKGMSAVFWHTGFSLVKEDVPVFSASLIVDDATRSILGADMYFEKEEFESHRISHDVYGVMSLTMDLLIMQLENAEWEARAPYEGNPTHREYILHAKTQTHTYQFLLITEPLWLNFNYYNSNFYDYAEEED